MEANTPPLGFRSSAMLQAQSREATPAYATFQKNVADMHRLFMVVEEDLFNREREAERLARKVQKRLPGSTQSFERIYRDVSKTIDFVQRWCIVMVVTAAETYLQDALAYCALVDPSIMSDVAQVASYNEVLGAQSTQDLAGLLRLRWARNFVDKGGPATWIERLQRMGARPFRSALGADLEKIWGIRHVVVHRAGVVTHDFAQRYPEFEAEPSQLLHLDMPVVFEASDRIEEFARHTDSLISGRAQAKSQPGPLPVT
jgi:hypothetical protein